jgi:predicted dehydrogenase
MADTIAFYGAGSLAQPYLHHLAREPGVRVTAVCDLDRRAAEQVAAGWGARVFLSYEAMLQEARPTALFICVPPHLQGDVILKAAELRIPFFVEPPGAVDFERARVYGRAVAAAKLVTAVGYTARYADVVREAREYLGTNPVPLALASWLRPPEESNLTALGLLWTEGCRLVDGLRCFCGDVDRVRALGASVGVASGGVVAQLEFAGFGVGVLTCATFARPDPRVELELLGEGWTLGFGAGFAALRLAERDKTTILRCLNTPAADHAAAFLEAVRTGNPAAVEAGYADALQTLLVCQAAAVSAREGRPVRLAEIEHAEAPAAPG